jgi:hypothetical protein
MQTREWIDPPLARSIDPIARSGARMKADGVRMRRACPQSYVLGRIACWDWRGRGAVEALASLSYLLRVKEGLVHHPFQSTLTFGFTFRGHNFSGFQLLKAIVGLSMMQ